VQLPIIISRHATFLLSFSRCRSTTIPIRRANARTFAHARKIQKRFTVSFSFRTNFSLFSYDNGYTERDIICNITRNVNEFFARTRFESNKRAFVKSAATSQPIRTLVNTAAQNVLIYHLALSQLLRKCVKHIRNLISKHKLTVNFAETSTTASISVFGKSHRRLMNY